MKQQLFILVIFISACQPNLDEVADSTVRIDPLKSWSDQTAKEAIVTFVEEAVTEGMANYIPPEKRIAVFDNDGTLWTEQPYYFQLQYAIDYIRKNAEAHPEWNDSDNVKAIIDGDLSKFFGGGEHALLEAVMISHSSMTTEEFSESVYDWLQSARHPKTDQPYNKMVYQPMLELLDYLRDNDFKTFIVSGGGVDFMRVWVEEAYDIPPYQVVGSSIKASYEVKNDTPSIVKTPEINFIDDKEGKPVGIHQHIGMKPVIAVGNSDGDYQMLEYTTSGEGSHLGILIHHTDSVREYAYDRNSAIGRLEKGLDDAEENGWIIVDMAKDWEKIYPFN